VSDSPFGRLIEAIDSRDVDAVLALATPDIRFLFVDGRRGEDADALRAVLTEFFGELYSTDHRLTSQWYVDDVWIAEVEADYELRDHLRLHALPRALVVRKSAEGITDLRVYGAHEHRLTDRQTREHGLLVGGHWIPPL
jgi:SnoaL-like domain